jgi:hypothetical protein
MMNYEKVLKCDLFQKASRVVILTALLGGFVAITSVQANPTEELKKGAANTVKVNSSSVLLKKAQKILNKELWKAICRKDLKRIQYLVEHGANPNMPNQFGQTPLDRAKKSGQQEIIDYLRSHSDLKVDSQVIVETAQKIEEIKSHSKNKSDTHSGRLSGSFKDPFEKGNTIGVKNLKTLKEDFKSIAPKSEDAFYGMQEQDFDDLLDWFAASSNVTDSLQNERHNTPKKHRRSSNKSTLPKSTPVKSSSNLPANNANGKLPINDVNRKRITCFVEIKDKAYYKYSDGTKGTKVKRKDEKNLVRAVGNALQYNF